MHLNLEMCHKSDKYIFTVNVLGAHLPCKAISCYFLDFILPLFCKAIKVPFTANTTCVYLRRRRISRK